MKHIKDLNTLNQIEDSLNKYQKIFELDGTSSKKEQAKLKQLFLVLKKAEEKLKTLSKIEEQQLLDLGKQQITDLESLEVVSQKIQQIIPDFLPLFKGIIEGCTLTVMNYGVVSIDKEHFLQGGTQLFAMNSNPVERIKVPRNCTGTISLKSSWLYQQDPAGITWHSFGEKIQAASRLYSIDYTFAVDEDGNIQIFKGTLTKESDVLEDIADLIFYLRDLEVELQNNNTLSITGGIAENGKSAFSEAITHYLSVLKTKKKDFVTSFSLVLEVEEEIIKKMPTKTKELVFEKENQAILSSDQTSVLVQWWSDLNPTLKTQIERKEVCIKVIGFTSRTGTNNYNLDLGEQRALDVGQKLATIIGKDLKGDSIADIYPSSIGEDSDNPKRYVMIIVKKR